MIESLKIIRERWVAVLVALLIGILGAAGTWTVRPSTYSASITLYVSAQTADNTQTAFQGAQLSEQRVTSYVDMVSSTRVADAVVEKLQLQESPTDLASRIAASTTADSVLINVALRDESPQKAADIVNAVGAVFTTLVDELERPITPGAVAPVAIRVLQPATVPSIPSSMSLSSTLLLGGLIGLLVGLLGVLLREFTDNSIKTTDEAAAAAQSVNLGTTKIQRKSEDSRHLPVAFDPTSIDAETFRQIRTNLQYLDVDRPPRIVLATSAHAGEGKTTTIANLGLAISATGSRVLLVEADLRRPALSSLFGLERAAGLTTALVGRAPVESVVQQWNGSTLDILASGRTPPNPSELLGSAHMSRLLEELRNHYDVVLIDTPPVLPVADAIALAPATDGVLLIAQHGVTSRQDVAAASEAIRSVSARVLGTILTMAPERSMTDRYHAYDQQYFSSSGDYPTVIKRRSAPRSEGIGASYQRS